jgi:hypothetical protein
MARRLLDRRRGPRSGQVTPTALAKPTLMLGGSGKLRLRVSSRFEVSAACRPLSRLPTRKARRQTAPTSCGCDGGFLKSAPENSVSYEINSLTTLV